MLDPLYLQVRNPRPARRGFQNRIPPLHRQKVSDLPSYSTSDTRDAEENADQAPDQAAPTSDLYIDALLAGLDDPDPEPSQPATDPALSNAPTATEALDRDARAAVAELDEQIDEPEPTLIERRRDLYFTIKGWAQNARVNAKAKSDAWDKLADAARARIHAPEREAKAEARRLRDNERRRVERAGQTTAKRIAALDRACANQRGNHFLVNMTGRSNQLAEFRAALTKAREQHGPKASLRQIAAAASITKSQARRRLEDVEKLEAPKGAWYRFRNQ